MLTNTTSDDEAVGNNATSPILENLFNAFRSEWSKWSKKNSADLLKKKAHIDLVKSNKKFDKVEEMKYYFIQRHRVAISALHGTPKGALIDKKFFVTMAAVAAIERSDQSIEEQLEHQIMALQFGMREIKGIIAGRPHLDD